MKLLLSVAIVLLTTMVQAQNIKGAWRMGDPKGKNAVLIIDSNYLVFSQYDLAGKEFDYTEGGTFNLKDGELVYTSEFHSKKAERVGEVETWKVKSKGKKLELTTSGNKKLTLDRIDSSSSPMAGVWHITGRVQEGSDKMVKIHQTGTRKTIKVLSDTRFQWIAIDPAAKGFYGTGGGVYTAKDGKYTENIEFFSRDNSRVGASLIFNWKLDNGQWDHSGLSSKGDPIHEIWEKVK